MPMHDIMNLAADSVSFRKVFQIFNLNKISNNEGKLKKIIRHSLVNTSWLYSTHGE